MSIMRDEICQQPAAVESTLQAEWSRAQELRQHFERNPPRLIVLAARGTSDNAAQFGRYLLEISTGIPVSLAAPSVYSLYRSKVRLDGTVVIGISQSGESTDTNLVLEAANAAGAHTIGITNESASTLAKLASETLLVRAGKEKSVAATKTYTGQQICFYLLAYAFGAPLAYDELARIPDWIQAALSLENQIRERAERYCYMQHAVCVGRGLNYSNSFEFALKLMETCYVVAERFSSADLLHGPIAMLERSFPAFLFCPAGATWEAMRELYTKLQSIQADTVIISDQSNNEIGKLDGLLQPPFLIRAPLAQTATALPADLYTPIPYVIPAQLFAASLAEAKHLDPDKPRSLKKVTENL